MLQDWTRAYPAHSKGSVRTVWVCVLCCQFILLSWLSGAWSGPFTETELTTIPVSPAERRLFQSLRSDVARVRAYGIEQYAWLEVSKDRRVRHLVGERLRQAYWRESDCGVRNRITSACAGILEEMPDGSVDVFAAALREEWGANGDPSLVDAYSFVSAFALAQQSLVRLAPRSLPVLEKLLQDKSEITQDAAVECLLKIPGGGHKILVPFLVSRVNNHPDEYVRTTAVANLGRIGEGARDALPSLLIFANTCSNPYDRATTAASICRIDPKHEARLPVLVRMLTQGDSANRENAAAELRVLCEYPDSAEKYGQSLVPVLIRSLSDEIEDVRLNALNGLIYLPEVGKLGRPLFKSLACGDPSDKVRDLAMRFLEGLPD